MNNIGRSILGEGPRLRAALNVAAFKDGFEMIRAYYNFEPKFGGKCAA